MNNRQGGYVVDEQQTVRYIKFRLVLVSFLYYYLFYKLQKYPPPMTGFRSVLFNK